MYSKQDLSHVTKYDKYDRYSIDNRLGQYEGRVGKWKKINFFLRKNIPEANLSKKFSKEIFCKGVWYALWIEKKVKMD